MSITLLVIGAVVVFSAVAVIATRNAEPALAGEQTVVGLGDAAAETLATRGDRHPSIARADWQMTPVDDLTAAEDLLDYLEAQGYGERELVVLGNSCFAVRWK